MSCRYGSLSVLLFALAALPGCAALLNGATQDIIVQTSPPGAQCTMMRENAVIATIPQTPARVRVNRSPAEILVECHRDGHAMGRHRMKASNDGTTLGNVVGAGLMGMGIDSATHADQSYDGVISVPLAPAAAAAGGERQMAAAETLPAGDVSQASWVGQRAASARASRQIPTAPVGYVAPVPEKKPDEPKEAKPVKAAEAKPAETPAAAVATPATKPQPEAPAKPPAIAAMKAVPASGSGLWHAHLASHRTEGAAISEWQELLKKDPKLYGQFDPKIEWVDVKNRGSFARLLLGGWPERREADAACAKIRGPGRYCAAVKD